MTGVQPMPCPVLLGTVKSGGLPALLHRYTIEKKVAKVEKVLKKGVGVDSINHLGQTPLFCASLLGFVSVAEKLLQYGANPNHRCNDESTPIHAAVFSCNPWLLSSLLDAGGDLRLHDDQGRTPKDWAVAGAQENSPKMLAFLKRCESQMQRLLQTHLSGDVRSSPTSSKTLLNSPSLLKLLLPWGYELSHENKTSYKMSARDLMMQCFGYGKLCFGKPGLSLGLAASVPLICDGDLSQANDEPLNSFMCGSFIRMTNYSWKGCRVTVKELHDEILQQCEEKDGLLDLLISEQEYCCHVSHPHMLLLMAVSMSAGLDSTRLVYERVNVGSLYSLLHQKRDEFPLLQLVDLLSMVLQVCEVLMYLNSRSLVLRALSSHTVLIVHPGVAKVTGLGFMVPSEGTCLYSPPPVPVPLSLINWVAPEVIRCRACTGKADLYSVCALIQEIYTDAVPWGPMDPRCIKRSVEAGQALIAHPAVSEPYYQLLQTGLQYRAQHRTSSLHDLCYNLRCYIREIRSENKRSGWNSWSALQCIPGWETDINLAKEQDAAVFQNCRTAVHNDIQDHHLEGIYTEEEKSTSDTDDLHLDISHHDNIPLHEWPITHHAPLLEPSCSNYIDTDKDLAISSSISKHIGSIVLNLKVSEVLLQQAEQSLDNVEATRLSTPCFDEVDAHQKERSDSVWKAFGPPSKSYTPEWTINADDEVSQYSSAQDESFESTSYPSSVQEEESDFKSVEAIKRGPQQTGRQRLNVQLGLSRNQKDRAYRSLAEHYQTKPTWTSDVSDVVALMARGCLGKPRGAVGSSDSEDVEEQQLHLQDWQTHNVRHSVNSHPEYETQESTDLEQLFKSFAGIQSDSEESTNYHTINQTFDVTNGVLKATSQTEDEGSSDSSAYTQTPLELSNVFYTPKHHLSKSTSSGVEHSQSLSSEDELDVTVEVCRPSTSPAEEKQPVENSLSEYQLAQEDSKESESITPVHRYIPTLSCLPDLAEIADLSSISCSPAQHQKWLGSAEAPPIPHSRGHPPCNSTPRSPKGRRTLQDVQISSEPLPHLQSLLDTSPWGGAPSYTVCTESYATASAGDSSNTNASVSSVLQSPLKREMSKEETYSPSSGNAEFTTASSGARQTTETSQETSEEMGHPIDKNNHLDEEVGDSKHQESSDEKVFEDEDISKRKEECKGENHDHLPDLNSADMESNANSQKSNKSHSLDDTERASSTLDEDLERMHSERVPRQRTPDIKAEGDVKDLDCPERDYIETAGLLILSVEGINKLGVRIEAANQENHSNRALEHTPSESVKPHC
ncbi:inactive serine/threonine-protein kinase TEX14-like [Pimephales promelas]|uniref:inactive serine/threonine-protein kinase TEX14-like n=1 Tax=Pimephales promelas TaxID=90988 RepID=UPI001955730C|nr:inactive serine/threonine-protein kinase TEX14-like [Pimephales promelas]KAG1970412.1 inactive serine/threonine-protein kinase TEX14 isoform a [Pimephales promelas]